MSSLTPNNRHPAGSWLGHPELCPTGCPAFQIRDANSLRQVAERHDCVAVWYPLTGADGATTSHVWFSADHGTALELATQALSDPKHPATILAASHDRILSIQPAARRYYPDFPDPPPDEETNL